MKILITLATILLFGCGNTYNKKSTEKQHHKESKMTNKIKVITGREEIQDIKNAEIMVLTKFYKAFNDRDLELMKNVWLNSEEASMNNPLGGIMRSWEEIRSVYERIFQGKAKVYVEFYDFTIHTTEDMFFATGRERGYFKTGEKEIPLAIRTSRIFKKKNGVWKQIQHHGSIDDPDLLNTYQELVKK